jgi:tRNA-modifying protein YgfZ
MGEIIAENYQVKLVDLGLIQVRGEQAARFLQGQLTCDVNAINEKQSRLGAHCDAKGRMQATFRLFFYQNAYYFLLPRTMIEHLTACLQKYAIFSAVNLCDVTQHWQIRGLLGPAVIPFLGHQTLLPEGENAVISTQLTLSLVMPGPPPRFILLTSNRELLSLLDTTFEHKTVNAWHLADIRAGIPVIYPETAAKFIPQQLNYTTIGGVSLNKGCYIGQEIVARTHYLGKSKSKLYRATFQSDRDFSIGASIIDEKNVPQGTMILSAKEKENAYQALICLQRQAVSNTIYVQALSGPVLRLLQFPYSIEQIECDPHS